MDTSQQNSILQSLLASKDNQLCIDCRKSQTEYIILDYGGFICSNCYKVHLSLNINQHIKPLSASLSPSELHIVSTGGNTALFEFWEFYNLNYKAISYKYSTNASQFYKKMLNDLVQGQENNSSLIDYEVGRNQSEHYLDSLSSLIEEVDIQREERIKARKMKPDKTLSDKIEDFGDSIVNSRVFKEIESGVDYVAKELNDIFGF